MNPEDDPNDSTLTPDPVEPEIDLNLDGEPDPERLKRLAANLREDKRKRDERIAALQRERDELAARVKAEEDAKLTEAQRQAQELEDARNELTNIRRQRAIEKHKLSEDALAFLTGTTAEEIETQAAKLAALAPKQDAPNPEPDITSGLTPAMAPGHVPSHPEPFDPRAVALAARRR